MSSRPRENQASRFLPTPLAVAAPADRAAGVERTHEQEAVSLLPVALRLNFHMDIFEGVSAASSARFADCHNSVVHRASSMNRRAFESGQCVVIMRQKKH